MNCDYQGWPINIRYGVPVSKESDLSPDVKDLQGTYSSLGVMLRHNFEKLQGKSIGLPHFLNLINRFRVFLAAKEDHTYTGDYTEDDTESVNQFLGKFMAPSKKELETHSTGASGLTRKKYESLDPTHGKYREWSQTPEQSQEQKERTQVRKEETKERKLGKPGENVRYFFFPVDQTEDEGNSSESDDEQPEAGTTKKRKSPSKSTSGTVWRVSAAKVKESGFLGTHKYMAIQEDSNGTGTGVKIAFYMGNRVNKLAMRKFYGSIPRSESKKVQKLKGNVLIVCLNSPMDLGEILPLKEDFSLSLPVVVPPTKKPNVDQLPEKDDPGKKDNKLNKQKK